MMGNLLNLTNLEKQDIDDLVSLANKFRDQKGAFRQDPIYHDKTIVSMFFEPSTRTKLSFQIASLNLGARFVDFNTTESSLNKGESIEDTIEALSMMGVDLCIIRHSEPIIYELAESFPNMKFINAGEGINSHPSQALLDYMTIKDFQDDISNMNITIVGHLDQSRVARSFCELISKTGYKSITFNGLPELCSDYLDHQLGDFENDLDKALTNADLIMALRIQKERLTDSLSIDYEDYLKSYQIDANRLKVANKNFLLFHPGPVNYGIELSSDVTDLPNMKIQNQIANGIGMRMAILTSLLS